MSKIETDLEEILNFLDDEYYTPPEEDPTPEEPTTEEETGDDPDELEEIETTEEEDASNEMSLEDLEKKVDNLSTPEEEEEEEQETTPISEYYNFLKKQDFLKTSEDFEFDGSAESFEEALIQTEESMAKEAMNQIWSRLPSEFQKALAYGLNGGASIKDYVREFVDDIDYNTFSIDSSESQKQILKEYFKKTTKHGEVKIEKLIEKFDDDELYDEAQDALDYLIDEVETEKQNKLDKLAQEKKQHELALKESNDKLVQMIRADKELPDKSKAALEEFVFRPKKIGGENVTTFAHSMKSIQQNPDHFIQFASLVMEYDPEKGFDLTKIKNKGKKEAVSGFKKQLEETVSKTQKSTSPAGPVKGAGWDELIKQLEL